MSNEEIFKEIDLIQSCINRMASNSFLIKGWALGIYAGVTALTKGENLSNVILMLCTTIIPFICFWVLDAYFLQMERKYRAMYEDRLSRRKKYDDSELFELNPNKYKTSSILRIMFSLTLMVFYGIPFFVSFIVLIIWPYIECFLS